MSKRSRKLDVAGSSPARDIPALWPNRIRRETSNLEIAGSTPARASNYFTDKGDFA